MFKSELNLLIIFLLLFPVTGPLIAAELDRILAIADKEIAAGSFDAARQTLDRAIEFSPQSSKAHQKLAALHMIQREYSQSIPLFQQAIGLDAKNGGAFIGLGFAYLHSGRYGPARAALLQAQSLIPEKAAEIQQIISWIDGRAPEQTGYTGLETTMPETVKAAVGHNNNQRLD